LAAQVCTVFPEHWVAPGVQTPSHAPLTHAELVHTTAVPQVPFGAQVCTPLAEHCVEPRLHTPTQAPLTHAEFVHAVAGLHWPCAPHVCTASPEHRTCPGRHTRRASDTLSAGSVLSPWPGSLLQPAPQATAAAIQVTFTKRTTTSAIFRTAFSSSAPEHYHRPSSR
jgi:hypothetical protein